MINKKLKKIFMYVLFNLLFIVILNVSAVHAQSWPQSRISFVVGFAPGGSTDIAARIVAQQLTIKLGQTVVVENKPGVSGVVGHNMIATAKPDGYSFLFGSGSLASSPSLMKSLPYDVMNDFVPVAQLTLVPTVVAVHPSVPAKNIKEFVDYVKANPGKVNYGSAGSGSLAHISGALFEKMIQGSMVHIPYKGGALANSDLVAGRVHVVFGPIVELMPFVSSGAIRALGVTSLMRSASFPDAHPVAEVVPGYEMSSWHGVFAPKGTNPDIVDAMNKAINAVLVDPATRTRLIALGLDPVKSTQQEFTKFYFDEIKRWKELVNIAGAKQE